MCLLRNICLIYFKPIIRLRQRHGYAKVESTQGAAMEDLRRFGFNRIIKHSYRLVIPNRKDPAILIERHIFQRDDSHSTA